MDIEYTILKMEGKKEVKSIPSAPTYQQGFIAIVCHSIYLGALLQDSTPQVATPCYATKIGSQASHPPSPVGVLYYVQLTSLSKYKENYKL